MPELWRHRCIRHLPLFEANQVSIGMTAPFDHSIRGDGLRAQSMRAWQYLLVLFPAWLEPSTGAASCDSLVWSSGHDLLFRPSVKCLVTMSFSNARSTPSRRDL